MSTTKRILALILTGALLISTMLSFTACGEDTAVALTVDGQDVNAGIYIYYLNRAYSELYSNLTEDSEVDSDYDVYSQTYENKSASDWIIDRAVELSAKYIAIQNEAKKVGASIDSTTKNYLDSYAEQYWEYYGENLSKMGIGEASFKSVYSLSYLEEDAFIKTYGEGGEKEVSDDELMKFMTENYARVKYYSFSKLDSDGNKKDDDTLSSIKSQIENLIALTENGKTYDEVIDAYEELQKQIEEAENTDSDAETDAETDTDTEVDPYARETMIYKDQTSPSEDFVKMAFEKTSADYGKVFLYEDDSNYYMVQILDPSERTDYLEDNHDSVLSTFKYEEFDEYIDSLAKELTVVRNEKAIKRYEPKKLGV